MFLHYKFQKFSQSASKVDLCLSLCDLRKTLGYTGGFGISRIGLSPRTISKMAITCSMLKPYPTTIYPWYYSG